MKANELQVGSWIMFGSEPHQVGALYADNSVKVVGDRCAYYLEHAEPIPITKELLEKNGFEREKLIPAYNHYIGIDNRVTLQDDYEGLNSNNVWDAHIDSEEYCTIAHCELTYLHELQHLLNLCKIDFEFSV